jgi:N-acetylmuramoyl-L-alanine amidase
MSIVNIVCNNKHVLLDLSQSATQEASVLLANKVLHSFESVSELHFEAVQKAGFAVLKSPDIPSILVETAFISNPTEELKLLSSGHQLKLATAILKGINAYMKQPSNDQRIALL